MPNIRSRDAKLQEAEGSLVKSSYVTMKLAEELAQAHSRGDLSPQLYDVLSDRCLHSHLEFGGCPAVGPSEKVSF